MPPRPLAPHHLPVSLALALALAAAMAGCDGGPTVMDGGVIMDARVRDASGLLDGGVSEAGPALDASSRVDASVPRCVSACDPRSGDGCGSAGRCVLSASEPTCVAMPGALAPGSDCTDTTECAPGAACFEVEGVGRCQRICCPGDESACDVEESCSGSGRLVDGAETEWGRCLPSRSCDVLDAAADCEAREGCYIVGSDGQTECRYAGAGGPGDPCVAQQDCGPGFFCGGVDPARRCRRICDARNDDCPIDEGRCVVQAHSPDGSGICTIDMATRQAMAR